MLPLQGTHPAVTAFSPLIFSPISKKTANPDIIQGCSSEIYKNSTIRRQKMIP